MASERFVDEVFAAPDLVITIGEPPTAKPHSDIGLGPEGMAEAELAAEKGGGDRQSQRQIGADELGLVEEVKEIPGHRPMPLGRLVVAELQQLPLVGVDLGVTGIGDKN